MLLFFFRIPFILLQCTLKIIIKEQAPRIEVLIILFAEAEHTVNSRHLVLTFHQKVKKEGLTPNHVLKEHQAIYSYL